MMQVNASYGPMTPDTAATQSLAGSSTSLTRSFIRDCLIIEYSVHIHSFIHSFIRDCLIIEYPVQIHSLVIYSQTFIVVREA